MSKGKECEEKPEEWSRPLRCSTDGVHVTGLCETGYLIWKRAVKQWNSESTAVKGPGREKYFKIIEELHMHVAACVGG